MFLIQKSKLFQNSFDSACPPIHPQHIDPKQNYSCLWVLDLQSKYSCCPKRSRLKKDRFKIELREIFWPQSHCRGKKHFQRHNKFFFPYSPLNHMPLKKTTAFPLELFDLYHDIAML